MKLERLSENQIRCTLNKSDLVSVETAKEIKEIYEGCNYEVFISFYFIA